ncbi:hypothetical protein P8452_30549 [Trifolium repens]|nr:hypothetical protein P8452_30549 [Trifolium repens]
MPDLPFQVGDLIEAKSFLNGYRGAWFRCKITKIGKREGVMSYLLEYPDYPDQSMFFAPSYKFEFSAV